MLCVIRIYEMLEYIDFQSLLLNICHLASNDFKAQRFK